ncbi:MAG: hypothetical protein GKR89_29935 [Candidatus Latescibacteria bacterium]|nr:hypothetical protein [Candidatus Latescibacterota bacterium]
MRRGQLFFASLVGLVLTGAWLGQAAAQDDYGNRLGRRVGERTVYSVTGPAQHMRALDPTVQRWYLPQELFSEYGRRQWQYTNYSENFYRTYLNRSQEGFYFYDSYGDLITRGWLIYDWSQSQPRTFESSSITKRGQYSSWFNRLIISSDAGQGYNYSIIIGDEVRTTLTPMTFRKVGFNGVVTSLASDRWRATGLFSRISLPLVAFTSGSQQNFTNLAGGRFEADITDFLRLGATYVNAHNGSGSRESFQDNPFHGILTAGQLDRRLNLLVVRLSDDSPEDGVGGAVLFAEDIEIETTITRQVTVGDSVEMVPRDTLIVGSSIGFQAAREGGTVRDGFLTADGGESITLRYVLGPEEGESEIGSLRLQLQQSLGLSLSEAEDALTNISNVRFRLVLANDYRVEVASDRQTNPVGQPQFLTMARASGNIKNRLNQREVVFDYGLPTASQIYGFTAEARDWHGFDLYGEFNINTRYRKYPQTISKKHKAISGIVGDKSSVGWMFNLAKQQGAWFFFAEAFGMDADYSTSVRPVDGQGGVDYSPGADEFDYEFVDDNDDNDRHPDRKRRDQGNLIPISGQFFSLDREGVADPAVFPGYDENGDFISDFNQNSNGDRENFFPDYDEPFLRYRSDRPEFLFGLDLNNNGWGDRFENDNEADYPYRRDHWGYNIYSRVQVIPELELTGGVLNQEQDKTARKNETLYGMVTFEKDFAGRGRLRLFDMARKAEDTIADDLFQWVVPRVQFGRTSDNAGSNQAVPDLLAAEDTWINTFYADWAYFSPSNWATRHRFKWEVWKQRDADIEFALDEAGEILLDQNGEQVVLFDPLGPLVRNARETSGFIGLIDKAEYAFSIDRFNISPRLKSEWLVETPFSRTQEKRRSWDGLFFFMVDFPLLRKTTAQLGLEQRLFTNLRGDEDEMPEGSFTGDFRGTVLAAQLTNKGAYQGYNLITQVGVRYDRRSLEVIDADRESQTSGLAFITVFAGL